MNQYIAKKVNKNKDILAALEERWALWLLKLDDKQLYQEYDKVLPLFKVFEKVILKDLGEDTILENPKYSTIIKNPKYYKIIKNPKYYLRQGLTFFNEGELKKALEFFEKSSMGNQLDPLPHYYKGLVHIRQDNNNEARKEIGKSIALYGNKIACRKAIKSLYKHPELQSVRSIEEEKNDEDISNNNTKLINNEIQNKLSNNEFKNIDDPISIEEAFRYRLIEIKNDLKNNKKFDFKLEPIENIFNITKFKEEINSLKIDGLKQFPVIQGKKSRPTLAIVCLSALGISEIIAGTLITILTAGIATPWGAGLVIEGISDILNAGVAYKSRAFNKKVYFRTKIFSLALVASGVGVFAHIGGKVIALGGGALIQPITAICVNNSNERKEKLEKIKEEQKITEKFDLICENLNTYDEDTQKKEYDIFERLSLAEIEKNLDKELFQEHKTINEEINDNLEEKIEIENKDNLKLWDGLKYLVCIPKYDKILASEYEEALDETQRLIDNFIEIHKNPNTFLKNSGNNAFSLFKKNNIIEKFNEKFIDILTIYTKQDLICKILSSMEPDIQAHIKKLDNLINSDNNNNEIDEKEDNQIKEEQKEDNDKIQEDQTYSDSIINNYEKNPIQETIEFQKIAKAAEQTIEKAKERKLELLENINKAKKQKMKLLQKIKKAKNKKTKGKIQTAINKKGKEVETLSDKYTSIVSALEDIKKCMIITPPFKEFEKSCKTEDGKKNIDEDINKWISVLENKDIFTKDLNEFIISDNAKEKIEGITEDIDNDYTDEEDLDGNETDDHDNTDSEEDLDDDDTDVEDIDDKLKVIFSKDKTLNLIYIKPFGHLYTSLLKVEKNKKKLKEQLLEKSKSGEGSLVQYFFNKYMNYNATLYRIDVKDKLKPAPLQQVKKGGNML